MANPNQARDKDGKWTRFNNAARKAAGVRPDLLSVPQSEAEEAILLQHFETAVIYDQNGNPVFTKDGDEYHVPFSPEEMHSFMNKDLLHNHPVISSEDLAATLSDGDVRAFYIFGLKSIKAVSQGGEAKISRVSDVNLFEGMSVARKAFEANVRANRFDQMFTDAFTEAVDKYIIMGNVANFQGLDIEDLTSSGNFLNKVWSRFAIANGFVFQHKEY